MYVYQESGARKTAKGLAATGISIFLAGPFCRAPPFFDWQSGRGPWNSSSNMA